MSRSDATCATKLKSMAWPLTETAYKPAHRYNAISTSSGEAFLMILGDARR
jgi:hypothetical protein